MNPTKCFNPNPFIRCSFYTVLTVISILLFGYCTHDESIGGEVNPPVEGFNLEQSDPKAVQLADSVMMAMGGRQQWDETRYLSWIFFGNRKHYWDKYSGDIIIQSLRDSLRIEMNINDPETIKLVMDGEEVNAPDSLSKYWELGKSWWINDSYWFIMPFKLKDSGVTLKYIGLDTTINQELSHKLELTFENVGRTPENRYEVYIDTSNYLVDQWDYYRNSNDSIPRFQLPWSNYQEFNGILLSSDRGDQLKITEISVNDTLARIFQK